MSKSYWIAWSKAAGVRAVKTAAQSALGVIGASACMGEVNWLMVGSAAGLAAIASVLTSIAGLPEVPAEPSEPKDDSITHDISAAIDDDAEGGE